jgi:8-hydroxy-5-deazaflavin:NADPH oxidoreductase
MGGSYPIGILGSGAAAQTLGRGLVGIGHPVMLGSRNPAKLTEWAEDVGPDAHVGAVSEAARFGELLILSVLGRAAEDVVRSAGLENLEQKVLIDASDPLDFSSGRPGLFVGTVDSLGERIQRVAPQARVVKALNIVLADVMIEPGLSGGSPDMFIAGDDEAAKEMVTELLGRFGWPVIDLGGIENARWLEALSLLWVVYSHRTGKTHHAFKLEGK